MKDRFLDSERGGGKKVKLDPLGFHIYSLILIYMIVLVMLIIHMYIYEDMLT